MRRVTTTIRTYGTQPPSVDDMWKLVKLGKIWDKYNTRYQVLDPNEETVVKVTRDEKGKSNYFRYFSSHRLRIIPGVTPHVLSAPQDDGFIETAKSYVKGYMRNGFVRGLGLDDEKEELLENGKIVFFEVLRAYRENDFSSLTEFTLGGDETLQFHRNAAQKLTKLQKESLNITESDLLGKSGYLIKYPYFKNQLGPYMHSIELVPVDAMGNEYIMETENGKKEPKIFCRYRLIMGGVYKFESLLKDVAKGEGLWSTKIKTPRDYGFKWPRYTFVVLDVCQEAEREFTKIRLKNSRKLYDFHVFSF